MPTYVSRLALLSLFTALALSACRAITDPFVDQGQVDHIDVWPGGPVQVGDTVTASADAVKANGIFTAFAAPRSWSIADPSMAEIRGGLPFGRVLLKGLRPGTTLVTARIGDVEGSAPLRVIPRLAPITFSPSAVSMHLGDSTQVTADIRSASGEPITDVDVSWRTSDIGVVNTGCCSASIWLRSSKAYGTPGTASVTATLAHATGSLQVTVAP